MSFSSSSSFLNYNELVERGLNPGDLIEIDRGNYNHWVMFSNQSHNGTHWCFHVTTTDGDCEKKRALMSSVRNAVAGIKKHKLKDILEDNDSKKPSLARVNNKIEEAERKKCVPRRIEQVIENLEKLKDERVEYNLTDSNCEHYVTNWKFGTGWSSQVELATKVSKYSLVGVSVSVGVGVGVGMLIVGNFGILGGILRSTRSIRSTSD